MSDLTLYELPPSPNNQKARIALGYKGLRFERSILEFDHFPGDRGLIVDVSGQPRTPVLKHRDTVIFDSGAILRYLEANFRDTPRLFSTDWHEFGEIERWEWFARVQLAESVSMMFGQALGPDKNPDTIRRANDMMRGLTGRIEDQLSQTTYLTGDHLTAADVTAAPLVNLAALTSYPEAGPVVKFFAENLTLGDERDNTRAWLRKVLAHDPMMS